MPTELQHDGPFKFALAGLDLNVPPDLVPPTKYSRATNVVSKIEGQLQARDGHMLVAIVDAGVPIHTIFRLTQSNPTIVGERLVGAGTALYTAPLPAGNVFTPITGGPSFDGGPLSIIQFRFQSDPAVWAIIANSAGMMKHRTGYYQVLGVAPPTVMASASAGSTGLLNSSTGTGYDWRYTYLNEVTLSESNGSPITTPSGGGSSVTVEYPASYTNPSPGGGTAYVNPSLAIDGNPATFASGSPSVSDDTGNDTQQISSCQWENPLAVPGGLAASIVLTVKSSVSIDTVLNGYGASSNSQATLQYSLDGGLTWNNIYSVSSGAGIARTDTANLSAGAYLPGLIVRSIAVADAKGIPPSPANPGGAPTTSNVVVDVFDISLTITSVAGGAQTLALTNQSAVICVTPPTDPQETAIRLYRRGGTLPDNWFQIGQFPISTLVQGACGAGTLEIDDNVPDSTAELGAILPQDNFQPIQSVTAVNFPLPVIFGPSSDGRVLGCGDPARPDSVYFTNPGNADIWPAENWVVVANPGEQIMNGLEYALRVFVFSREQMYIMLLNIIAGVTFTPAETSCRRGLKGRWALCKGEQGIYFVSKDGVYRTQGGPEQSIIDDSLRPLFPTREAPVGIPVGLYDAVDLSQEDSLRLAFHNGEIWFYYIGLTTQQQQLMIFDERRSRWRPSSYTPAMQMAYSEPNTSSSLLFGGRDGSLYAAGGTNDNGAAIPVDILTGAMDQGRPLNLKEYQTLVVDIDPGQRSKLLLKPPYTPVTITPYVNGDAVIESAVVVSGIGRQRVPIPLNQGGVEVYAYNISFEVQWNEDTNTRPILYQYETLYRHEPAEVTHWELPPSSLGMDGWFHIRDGYITLRSNADVTLTITPSVGLAQTFLLLSTNGAKQKLYFQMAESKAKNYAFALDSAATFRVYADESEVRAKQWLTKLGYKNIPIVGREQVGKPFGLTNV